MTFFGNLTYHESDWHRNIVHGSDSPDNGQREIGKFLNYLVSFCYSNFFLDKLKWVAKLFFADKFEGIIGRK